ALKRMEKNGKLPSTIKQVKPPGYWKRDGRYMLRILFRCDSYHIREGHLDLPHHLSVAFRGKLKWIGRQGRLEVAWDTLSKKWRVFQPVNVKSIITPLGSKTCYIDMASETSQPSGSQNGVNQSHTSPAACWQIGGTGPTA
ncbi:hypothetical protein MUP07_11430, partial [Candidatus Bathyarchaeota archaeon]|nr:hypothetical protein [Candidatus Bathyarchaeota archaeon]